MEFLSDNSHSKSRKLPFKTPKIRDKITDNWAYKCLLITGKQGIGKATAIICAANDLDADVKSYFGS